MTQRNSQVPAAAEQIRKVPLSGTGRSLSKRKDRPSPQQAETEAPATNVRSQIEKLAYSLYQQRGQQDGYDYQDWLEAERIVQASSAPQSHEGSGHLAPPSLHIA